MVSGLCGVREIIQETAVVVDDDDDVHAGDIVPDHLWGDPSTGASPLTYWEVGCNLLFRQSSGSCFTPSLPFWGAVSASKMGESLGLVERKHKGH